MNTVKSYSPAKLLIVEDESVVRNLMMRVLVRAGFRVLEADSAAEALEVSAQFDGVIDLLVADHTLKTMTGRQVAEQIRQSRPNLKVLQISGHFVEQLEEEGGRLPDAEFLAKPFHPMELVRTVEKMQTATKCGGQF
jgi:CheY-like chemotaxis protein